MIVVAMLGSVFVVRGDVVEKVMRGGVRCVVGMEAKGVIEFAQRARGAG